MDTWELIFRQSRANSASYFGDRFPAQNWDWPRGTWFQTRLRFLRAGNGRYTRALPQERLH
jgi:hypothetical protein